MSKVIVLSILEKVVTFTLVFIFIWRFPFRDNSNLFNGTPQPQGVSDSSNQMTFSSIKQYIRQQAAAVVLDAENAKFRLAIAFTLRHEGGLVNDKSDKGGITKYGISYRFLHQLLVQHPEYLSLFSLTDVKQVSPSTIKNLTLQQALQIYKNEWWEKYHYGAIKNQAIAAKAFDYSVNMGSVPAIKLLQIACQDETHTQSVEVNGQLDNSTLTYINSLNSSQENQLLYAYENEASKYYVNIAKQHPADKKFLSGWLRRSNDNNSLPTSIAV